MERELIRLSSDVVKQSTVREIVSLNTLSSQYGLSLQGRQAEELIASQRLSLCGADRMDFSGGIAGKIIAGFCSSPYLQQENYVEARCELVDIFYYYKNELPSGLSDEGLVRLMRKLFDGVCGGSLEMLANGDLNALARGLKTGEFDPQDESEESDGGTV